MCCFFFKHKAAYGMRISDWSSDVCSSDLRGAGMNHYPASHWGIYEVERDAGGAPSLKPYSGDPDFSRIGLHQLDDDLMRLRVRRPAVRESWSSEERRVGQECVGTGQFRWSPHH